MPLSPEAKLREGTEILRTGGGTELTAADCNTLLEASTCSNRPSRPCERLPPPVAPRRSGSARGRGRQTHHRVPG
jgi:hypothetical protein